MASEVFSKLNDSMILYSICLSSKKHLLNMFCLHLRSTLSSSFPHSTGIDQNQIQPLFHVALAGRVLLPWRDPLLSAQSMGTPSFISTILCTMEYAEVEVEGVGLVFPSPEAPEVIFSRHLLQAALALLLCPGQSTTGHTPQGFLPHHAFLTYFFPSLAGELGLQSRCWLISLMPLCEVIPEQGDAVLVSHSITLAGMPQPHLQ